MSDVEVEVMEPQEEEEKEITKWTRTTLCGCGECRYIPIGERDCPLKDAPGAIWLWVSNPQMIGQLDYIPSHYGSPDSPSPEPEPEEVTES
jgi:hypothetical protein